MRPGPQELVDGVRRVLKDVVEPELTSDFARQRLAEVRAVLAQVDWDDAGLRLASRTAELRSALMSLRAVGVGPPSLDEVLDQPLGTSWAVLSLQHQACSTALVELLPALDDEPGLGPQRARVLAALLRP